MSVVMKRTLTGIITAAIMFVGAIFVAWGFNPASWEWFDRLLFLAAVVGPALFAATFPFED